VVVKVKRVLFQIEENLENIKRHGPVPFKMSQSAKHCYMLAVLWIRIRIQGGKNDPEK
jgi:hypothetical protein